MGARCNWAAGAEIFVGDQFDMRSISQNPEANHTHGAPHVNGAVILRLCGVYVRLSD